MDTSSGGSHGELSDSCIVGNLDCPSGGGVRLCKEEWSEETKHFLEFYKTELEYNYSDDILGIKVCYKKLLDLRDMLLNNAPNLDFPNSANVGGDLPDLNRFLAELNYRDDTFDGLVKEALSFREENVSGSEKLLELLVSTLEAGRLSIPDEEVLSIVKEKCSGLSTNYSLEEALECGELLSKAFSDCFAG